MYPLAGSIVGFDLGLVGVVKTANIEPRTHVEPTVSGSAAHPAKKADQLSLEEPAHQPENHVRQLQVVCCGRRQTHGNDDRPDAPLLEGHFTRRPNIASYLERPGLLTNKKRKRTD